ncbi:MAG: hypothetical protein ACR2OE_10725 [Thermomicrobiales bacterium]
MPVQTLSFGIDARLKPGSHLVNAPVFHIGLGFSERNSQAVFSLKVAQEIKRALQDIFGTRVVAEFHNLIDLAFDL